MNCQEVMDYMQRQLDGDLDERETEILMAHTRHCPDCERVFERLQLLSAGLENLPKVTPRYSLVDAILPRIAEIQASGGPAAASEIERTAFVPQSDEAADETPVRRPARRPRTANKWAGKASLGALGGVIAAGIAVGLFIVNYNSGDPIRNAERMTASSDAAADAGADTFMAPNGAENKSMAGEQASGGAAPKKDEVSASSNGADAADRAVKDSGGSGPSANGELHGGADAASPDEPQSIMRFDKSSEAPKTQSPNFSESGSGGDAGSSAANDADRASGEAADPGGSANQEIAPNAHTAPGADQADQGAAAGGNEDKGSEGVYGIAAQTPPGVWTSPNGLYKAAFADSRLRVYAADDTLLFESPVRSNGVSSVSWSDDGKTLTYATKTSDGSTVTYSVDPVKGTETATAE